MPKLPDTPICTMYRLDAFDVIVAFEVFRRTRTTVWARVAAWSAPTHWYGVPRSTVPEKMSSYNLFDSPEHAVQHRMNMLQRSRNEALDKAARQLERIQQLDQKHYTHGVCTPVLTTHMEITHDVG